MNNPLETKSLFQTLDDLIWDKDLTLMEAIVHYCEENDVDIESIALVIAKSQVLKEQLYIEAEKLKMVEKINRLPE
jgi:hypothetical protein